MLQPILRVNVIITTININLHEKAIFPCSSFSKYRYKTLLRQTKLVVSSPPDNPEPSSIKHYIIIIESHGNASNR